MILFLAQLEKRHQRKKERMKTEVRTEACVNTQKDTIRTKRSWTSWVQIVFLQFFFHFMAFFITVFFAFMSPINIRFISTD